MIRAVHQGPHTNQQVFAAKRVGQCRFDLHQGWVNRRLTPASARTGPSETADSRSAFPLTDAAAFIAEDEALTDLTGGVDMTRFPMQEDHVPPVPAPDVLPLPLDPDKDPTPDLLPDDPDRDGVTQPVA